MSKKQFIKRYSLVINRLRKGPASFEEIQTFLAQQSALDEEKYTMSKRTLQRDLKEILSLYNIEIKSNRSQNRYEIIEDENDDRNERLMESFEILSALNLSKNLQNHLIIEKRKPLGTEHMHGLLHAINNKVEVTFNYTKHGNFTGIAESKQVKPIALKEARNRWYLITKDVFKDKIKAYALDRLDNLQITNTAFQITIPEDIDNFYKHSFGIITGEKEPKQIVLEFSIFQANFIKSFPLHHSQKILSENHEFCIMEYFLAPTYDFVMELMSIGKEVKIIEPDSLKQEILTKLKQNLAKYQ